MKSWTYLKETKSYLDEEGNEYIIRAGRPIKISSSDKSKDIYFRGLQNKYDPDFDKSKLDNPNGYESWTDSYDLAKEYAGKDGYVYSIEIDKDKVNKEDIFDSDGERSLMYSNDKPVALREVSGEEYMLYTDHDNWKDLDYKEVSSPENSFNTNYLTSKYDESYFEDKYAEMSDVSYDKLTSDERNLINDHYVKQEESYDINDEVRNGDLESHKDVVNALDKATHTYKTDEDLTLKRFDERKMLENVYGLKEGLSRDEIYNEMLNHIGETRDEKAYLSASLDESGNGMWNNLLVHSEINVPKGTDMYVADNIFEKEVILPRDTELVLKGVEFKESTIPGMEREYGKIVLQYELVKKDSKEIKSDGFSVRYLDKNGEELQVNASSREEADILKEQLNRGRIYDSDGNLVQSDREPREVLPKNDKVKEPRLSNSEISRLERLLYSNPDEKELRDFIKETELPWNYSDKNKTKQELWMMLKWQLEKEKEIRE